MVGDPLRFAQPCTRRWFERAFPGPTLAQRRGWPAIASGDSTLLLAPTGSGKTLAAFLVAIDRLMFAPAPPESDHPAPGGVRMLYISPLKALGVDVERNLRAPLAGIRAIADTSGTAYTLPSVAIRSGDTPQSERQRIRRSPPDILITTPESLYLMLSSGAREVLASVETVIVDEIHAMVASKRGAHLFYSLERLQRLRAGQPLQRIGLSATQRPLDEVGRLLAGLSLPDKATAEACPQPRPVTIIDASEPKRFEISVELPVDERAREAHESEDLGDAKAAESPIRSGNVALGPGRQSIWPSIYPRLVALIRAHRSTMVFVNSRRLAERLAGALNELAEAQIALAHHGSVAREVRSQIEDQLKAGTLPAIIATSSLELGLDLGAVDLVIQIEAPISVASGVQRIGRAGHQVGATSRGVLVPKYRGDLLACAAVVKHIREARVEATYYPRNPLDVLAQQIVAVVSEGPIEVEALWRLTRCCAPFAELGRRQFEGVLDMLSGRYPSDQFAELRPRITWDRIHARLSPRRGARQLAIANAGTIPDRGLYGVFLAGSDKPQRVGELDEEMVFEAHEGDVFVLGASSWRIEEITHDRVLVTPAPGEPGQMPFWHGDRTGRPLEFGRALGALTRELSALSPERALETLREQHGLAVPAARVLVDYLAEQVEATGRAPSDRHLVLERFIDEVGDLCITLHSPFGGRVHAPWTTAVAANLRAQTGIEVDSMWSDDGMVFRLPDVEEPPDSGLFFPAPDEVERLVTQQLSSTALFASHFRENAGRALLLPRRRPGQRTPLWAQRRRSANLLAVAANFPDFPIVLETYRECLRDVFDLPGLMALLGEVQERRLRVLEVQTERPSPFASSLLFNYVANYMYEGDAPLAEKRAQALSLDQAQLRDLLGEPELRELLDAAVITRVGRRLQRLEEDYKARHLDALHELLLRLGDLDEEELAERCAPREALSEWLRELLQTRRCVRVQLAGAVRLIAIEDVGRYRDALGIPPPAGVPTAFLESVPDPVGDLVARHARTHGPFTPAEVASRLGLGTGAVNLALEKLVASGRILEGEFLPGRRGRELCDAEVLRQIKRLSLARLRAEVEPVEPEALARFLPLWHGLETPGRSSDALLAAIERLQGAALPASALELDVLPARVHDFDPRELDALMAEGSLVWRGVEARNGGDGRIQLFLTDSLDLLATPMEPAEGELQAQIRALLQDRGALFFRDILQATGRLPGEALQALWDLVWCGEVSNDTLRPLRALRDARARPSRSQRPGRMARRGTTPGSEGRWWLLPSASTAVSETQRMEARVRLLLDRHGVLTREAVRAEGTPGGFAAIYPVLRALEEAGQVRRGYFVAGCGASQFAQPGAENQLRSVRRPPPDPQHGAVRVLAATDPANPYGAALPWPPHPHAARPQRTARARVLLWQGRLLGYLGPAGHSLQCFLPEDPVDAPIARAALVETLSRGTGTSNTSLLTRIDGENALESPLASALRAAGFQRTHKGLFRRHGSPEVPAPPGRPQHETDREKVDDARG